MAGGLLDTIGQGLGTGLGTALTPLAMLMAARGGRDPMAILRGTQAKEDALQQQANELKLAGLQAAGVQDPAIRDFLATHPELAGTFGLQTAPMGIAGPQFLERAGFPGTPTEYQPPDFAAGNLGGGVGTPGRVLPQSGNITLLPAEVQTEESLKRQGMMADLEGQQLARGLISGQQQPGGGTEGFVPLGYSVDPQSGRMNMQFGPRPTETREPGVQGPEGEVKAGDILGGKTQVIKLPRSAQQTQNFLTRIRAARATLDSLTGPINDPTTGQPLTKPGETGPIAVTWKDALLGTGLGSQIFAELPILPEMRARVLGRGGSWAGEGGRTTRAAAGRLQSMVGMVSAAARIGGEVGSLSAPEQDRFQQAFVPTERDSVFSGPQKVALLRSVMDNVEAALAQGKTPEQIGDIFRSGMDSAEALAGATTPQPGAGAMPQGGTTGTTSTTSTTLPGAGAGAPTPGGTPLAQAMEIERQKLLSKGTRPQVLRRATGGTVPAGALSLVGEEGPELIRGPAEVYPMQLAQAQPQQTRSVGAAPGMGGGTQVPVDPNAVKPPRSIGGTLGAATAKPTPQASGGIGVGTGLTDADRLLLKQFPDKYGITLGPGNRPMLMQKTP